MSNARRVHASIDWRHFHGNEVLLPICPRSPNVQGRNLTKMLDAMTPRISRVHVIMCDYMDRYNLDGDGEKALAQSTAWQTQYLPEITARFGKVELTDWLSIMKADGFSERLATLTRLYDTNAQVRRAIDINVQIYLDARVGRLAEGGTEDIDTAAIAENSKRYLIEEYAGTALYKYFVDNPAEVYWGIYINDLDVFQRHAKGVDLSLPLTLPVSNSRLGPSFASIEALPRAA
jgi:hypothetical protein